MTLLVLAVVVGGLSLGPSTLGEMLAGLTFERSPIASIAPATAHVDADLQRRLEGVSASITRGSLAAVAVDLQSGATASRSGQQAYPAASLFKLPILLEVLAEVDAGSLDARREIEIRPEDWTDGSGVLQARVGERLAVGELTRLMIQASDNIAALVLLDTVGAEAVNARAIDLGLHATRVVDHRAGDTAEHTTSAADMAHLLMLVATGQAVNARVSEAALATLELKQTFSWLSDGLPFWVKIAHKWGDLPSVRHDAGVVYSPRGNYVVAVLTTGVPPDDAARAIGRASRAAYDWLGSRPAS